jgi:hypothetical protein
MPSGYLYILTNPTIPGLAKVGKTTREPAERVAELSAATGVASPFVLLYQHPAADCDAAEAWVHEALSARGWRHASNREFFSAPPHEIVALIAQAAQQERPTERADAAGARPEANDAVSYVSNSDEASEGEHLASLALQIMWGGEDTLADRPRGAKLLRQAADLGFIPACQAVGRWLLRGELGLKKDWPSAYRYLVRGVEADDIVCHALLAELFMENGQRAAAHTQWQNYFVYTASRLLSLAEEHPDFLALAAHAGEHGRDYCGFVFLKRVDDVIDDACFFVLSPFIAQKYEEEKTHALRFSPMEQTKQRIRLDMEMSILREKSARGSALAPWNAQNDGDCE